MSVQPSPAGLRTMMALVRQSSDTNVAASVFAGRAYPVAQRIVHRLHAGDGEIDREFAVTVDRLFPGLEGEPTTGTSIQAGFYVGIATAWLLLELLHTPGRVR